MIKPPAAEARLHRHAGPAVVFDELRRHGRPDRRPGPRRWTRTRCWCCRAPARRARPGMPEWGQLPIPKKLLEKGVRDMVRISDARMSGTSYGACVLHVAPESLRRRPAGARPRRRHHRARRGRAPARPGRHRRGAGEAPRRLAAAPRRSSAAATARCTCSTSPRPTRAATSTSSKPARPPPSPRSTDRSQPADPSLTDGGHNRDRSRTACRRRVTRRRRRGGLRVATVRLTVAQALVRFLANQYSERDGRRAAADPGVFGIFGHGNVAGVGQALLEAQVTGVGATCRTTWPATSRAWCTRRSGTPGRATGCRRWPAPRRSGRARRTC